MSFYPNAKVSKFTGFALFFVEFRYINRRLEDDVELEQCAQRAIARSVREAKLGANIIMQGHLVHIRRLSAWSLKLAVLCMYAKR